MVFSQHVQHLPPRHVHQGYLASPSSPTLLPNSQSNMYIMPGLSTARPYPQIPDSYTSILGCPESILHSSYPFAPYSYDQPQVGHGISMMNSGLAPHSPQQTQFSQHVQHLSSRPVQKDHVPPPPWPIPLPNSQSNMHILPGLSTPRPYPQTPDSSKSRLGCLESTLYSSYPFAPHSYGQLQVKLNATTQYSPVSQMHARCISAKVHPKLPSECQSTPSVISLLHPDEQPPYSIEHTSPDGGRNYNKKTRKSSLEKSVEMMTPVEETIKARHEVSNAASSSSAKEHQNETFLEMVPCDRPKELALAIKRTETKVSAEREETPIQRERHIHVGGGTSQSIQSESPLAEYGVQIIYDPNPQSSSVKFNVEEENKSAVFSVDAAFPVTVPCVAGRKRRRWGKRKRILERVQFPHSSALNQEAPFHVTTSSKKRKRKKESIDLPKSFQPQSRLMGSQISVSTRQMTRKANATITYLENELSRVNTELTKRCLMAKAGEAALTRERARVDQLARSEGKNELLDKAFQKAEDIIKLQQSKINELSRVKIENESTLSRAGERVTSIQSQRDEAMNNLAVSEGKVESAKFALGVEQKKIYYLEEEIKLLHAENGNIAADRERLYAANEENILLKGQIESLEGQLGKANDVIQFIEDDAFIETKLLEKELQKAKGILKLQQSKIKELSQVKIECESTLTEAEERVTRIQAQRDETMYSLALSEVKVDLAMISLESGQKQNYDLEEEIKNLKAENRHLTIDRDRLSAWEEENIRLKEKIELLEGQLVKANDVIQFMEDEGELLEEELIKLQQSKNKETVENESTLTEAEERVTWIQAQRDKAMENLGVSERKVESLKIALKSEQKKSCVLELEIKNLKAENENLAVDRERCFADKEENIRLKEQIESLAGQLGKVSDVAQMMEDEVVKQMEELTTLKCAREKLTRSIIQDFRESEDFKDILEEEVRWWYWEGFNDYKRAVGLLDER